MPPNACGAEKLRSSISQEYGLTNVGGEGDSAAEDCSTGIALSSLEFTGQVFIAVLTQASFTKGLRR
jgi:hypothetical protein